MCGFIAYEGFDLDQEKVQTAFKLIKKRGPDRSSFFKTKEYSFGFHRLAIMDPSEKGDQPFFYKEKTLVCNGEIFNVRALKESLFDVTFNSHSDCEVLLPLLTKLGLKKTCELLDGEFAFVYWDEKIKKLLAARDPIGIRPLFYGKTKKGQMLFASEAKALINLCKKIKPFPPGHYYDGYKFHAYIDLCQVNEPTVKNKKLILKEIQEKLIKSVEKRLHSDVPLGFLLSGGLDSSLVCAIAQKKLKHPIKTFAVGMQKDSTDLRFAREAAQYIGSDHKEFYMTEKEVLESLEKVIYTLETWDITTIRASLGMYLLCKNISKETDVKVLLTGEVSDELFGYKYTDYAPSPEAFQKEAEKRIKELYMYDVLRADRCISSHGLEARVPFADKDFVHYVMTIDPKIKMNTKGIGKYLLRQSFTQGNYLPDSILFRDKEAFSDGVGHSLVDAVKAHCEKKYSDKDFTNKQEKYSFKKPISKEALFYREVYEKFYPGHSDLIKDYWMPNKDWENCNVNDPSARVLPNYSHIA